MTCKKLLIILRYISLILMFSSIIISHQNVIFLVLVYIIVLANNQLRIFKLANEERLVLISLLVELILCGFISSSLNNSFIFFILPCILDSIFLLTKERSQISLLVIIISFLLFQIPIELYHFFENTVVLGIIIIFCLYIKEEMENKVYIHQLSNKLKASEDKLKATTKTLEDSSTLLTEIDLLKDKNKNAKNLYNSISNSLSATLVQLTAIEHIAVKEKSRIEPLSKDLKDFVTTIYNDVKKECRSLKSTSNPDDWIDRIEELCKNFTKITNINATIKLSSNKWHINSNQASIIYKIVKDSFTNSLKYGFSNRIIINFNFLEESLSINIQDECTNCDLDKIIKSSFFTNIISRTSEIGGTANYTVAGTNGYILNLILPRYKLKKDE